MRNTLVNISLSSLILAILLLIVSSIELFLAPIPITSTIKTFFDIIAPILICGLWALSFGLLLIVHTVKQEETK